MPERQRSTKCSRASRRGLKGIGRGSEPCEEPSGRVAPEGRPVIWVARPHTSVASLSAARPASWVKHTMHLEALQALSRGHPASCDEKASCRVAAMVYTPPNELLERYANVLINFGLGGGRGIEPGSVVRIVAPEAAKPLYAELHRAVWRAGGHALGQYLTSDDDELNLTRDFYEVASDEQIDFLATSYMRGLIEQIDHQVSVLCDSDMHALEGIDPGRIMRHGRALKPVARLAHPEGERRSLQLDPGPVRHAGDGRRGGPLRAGVLGADHARLLPGRQRSDRALARAQRRRSRSTSSVSTNCRSSGCTSPARTSICTSRSASAASGSAAAAATSRASRSSRARTGAGPKAGSPSTSRSTATATSCGASAWSSPTAASCSASAEENEDVITEMVATDERRQASASSRSPTGASRGSPSSWRRRSTTRTSAARSATPTSPSASPTTTATRGTRPTPTPPSGSAWASTSRPSTPTSSPRPIASSPPPCAAAATRVIYADGEFQL